MAIYTGNRRISQIIKAFLLLFNIENVAKLCGFKCPKPQTVSKRKMILR